MRYVLVALLLSACSGGDPTVTVPDMARASSPDAAEPAADLANATDAAQPATCPDCDGFPAYTGDASQPVVPVDLATPCGGDGQACCPNYACDNSMSACMRSEADGDVRCIHSNGCGIYGQPPCSFDSAAWCGRDNVVIGGGWLTGSPCKSTP